MSLPLFCEKCGQVFEHPGLDLGGPGLTLTVNDGAQIGPHPGCGGYGHPVGGTYTFFEQGVKLVLDTARPAQDLEVVLALLRRAHGAASVDAIDAILETAPPWAKKLLNEVEELNAKTDENASLQTRQFYIALAIAILSFVLSQGVGLSPKAVSAVPRATIEQTIHDAVVGEQLSRARVDRSDHAGVGKNEKCPCGSGRKYKRCHGAPGADR